MLSNQLRDQLRTGERYNVACCSMLPTSGGRISKHSPQATDLLFNLASCKATQIKTISKHPSEGEVHELTTMTLPGEAIKSCEDACCAEQQNSTARQCSQENNFCQEACCTGERISTEGQYLRENESCQDKCCAEDKHSLPEESLKEGISCKDACCDSDPSRKDGNTCRAQERLLEQPSEDPPCCAGRKSPCCDKSCLDRLAARECQNGTDCSGEMSPRSATRA